MRSHLRKLELVCFLLGFFVFGVLVHRLGWTTIVENLNKTGPFFLVILIPSLNSRVFSALTLWFISRRTVGEKSPHFWSLFSLTLIATALRDAIPVIKIGGEIYKGVVLSKRLGAQASTQIVVQYNVAYLLGHFVLFYCGIVLAVFLMDFDVLNAILASAGLATILILVFFLLFRFGEKLVSFPLRFFSTQRQQKMKPRFDNARENLRSIQKQMRQYPADLSLATLIFAIGRILEAVELYLVVRVLGVAISYPEALMLDSLSLLINTVFFLFPYAAGVKEAGMSFLMMQLGFDSNLGIYAALMNRIIMLIWVFIGLVLLARGGLRGKIREILKGTKPAVVMLLVIILPVTAIGQDAKRKYLNRLKKKTKVAYTEFVHPHLIIQSGRKFLGTPDQTAEVVRKFLAEKKVSVPGNYPKTQTQWKVPDGVINLPKPAVEGRELDGILSCQVEVCKVKLNTLSERPLMEKAGKDERLKLYLKLIKNRIQLYLNQRKLPGYDKRQDRLPYVQKILDTLKFMAADYPACTRFMRDEFWQRKPGSCDVKSSFIRSGVDIIRPDKLRPIFRVSEVFHFKEGYGHLFFELYLYSNHYFDSVVRIFEVLPFSGKKEKSVVVVTDAMEIDGLVSNAVVRFLFKSQMETAIKGFQRDLLKSLE